MRFALDPRAVVTVGAVLFIFNVNGCGGQESASVDAAGTSGTGGSTPATGGAAGGQAATGGVSGAPGGQTGTGGQGKGGTGPGGASGQGGIGTGTGGKGGGAGGSSGGAGAAGHVGTGGAAGSKGGGGGTTATGGAGGNGGTKGRYSPAFVGNITTNDAVDTGGQTFSKYWDQITPENAGKWGVVQPTTSSSFNWKTLDAIHDYATKNNIAFKEHNFIWGSQQPSGTVGQTQVQAWMSAFCTRYPDTKMIDVVNEPVHTVPSYANNIGGGTNGNWQWVANAFTWARAACPSAVLILNDYNNIEWSGDQATFIKVVKAIQAAGAPIDAVGAQSHDLDYGGQITPTFVAGMLATLSTQSQLPVYITELDLSYTDDNQQLQAYQSFFPMLRDSGYVAGITIWGWIYGSTWSQAPYSGLIKNGTPRPAMTWLMQQLGRPTP